jgi:hypothetical protein
MEDHAGNWVRNLRLYMRLSADCCAQFAVVKKDMSNAQPSHERVLAVHSLSEGKN